MSLSDIKKRVARQAMPIRGQVSTSVATPAPAPEHKPIPPKLSIQITPSGPRALKFPGFMDTKNRPLWGSPEAEKLLEEAWRSWRLEHGELVDRS